MLYKLGLGYSELRNPNLGNLLKKFNIIEQWGTGFSKIKNELKDYKNITLEIDDLSQFTQIKLIQNNTTQKTTQKTTKELILDYLSLNNKLTRDNLAEKIGVSSNSIKQHLANLQKEQKLTRVGGRKDGYWKVLKNNLV